MRRLWSLLALALAGLMPSSATAATGTQAVTLDVAPTLTATFPTAYDFGDIAPGAAQVSPAQTVNVRSNATWGLRISSDLTDGRMAEFDAGAYIPVGGRTLALPLNWRLGSLAGVSQATTFVPVTAVPAPVTLAQGPTSDAGVDVGVLLNQTLSFADQRLGNAGDYRILLSYTASQGL